MTEEVNAALRAAVNIARNSGVTKVAVLRSRLHQAGHKPEDVQQALVFWANREKVKQC